MKASIFNLIEEEEEEKKKERKKKVYSKVCGTEIRPFHAIKCTKL